MPQDYTANHHTSDSVNFKFVIPLTAAEAAGVPSMTVGAAKYRTQR
jgi:hypothetical protein